MYLMQGQINLHDFMSNFVGSLLGFYAWSNDIYPFSDYPISLFWLFESTVLASLAYSLFPPQVADALLDAEQAELDDMKIGILPEDHEYYSEYGGYEDWEDDEHDVF